VGFLLQIDATFSSKDFYVGYEFLPMDDFRLGVAITIVGDSRYKNNQSNTRKVYQVDHGTLRNYQAYFAYDVDRTLSVFFKIHLPNGQNGHSNVLFNTVLF